MISTVTVALLCHNQGAYVTEALRSIERQSYGDFDVVVIDNGSTDDSASIIEAFVASTSLRCSFVTNPVNVGISRAFNQALDLSQSTYFVPFAADDVMLPDRLKHQVAIMNSLPDRYAVLSSGMRVFFESGEMGYPIYFRTFACISDLRAGLIVGNIPPGGGCMIRRSALDAIGGYDDFAPVEDFDLWLQLVFGAELKIFSDRTIVANYRKHSANTSDRQAYNTCARVYSLTKIKSESLTRSERRLVRRTLYRLVAPPRHWSSLLRALGPGGGTGVRPLAARALLDRHLRGVERLKALYALMFPSWAHQRVAGMAFDDSSDPPVTNSH